MRKTLLFVLFSALGIAQTPTKVATPRLVTIQCDCDDRVSMRVGTALRDQIALSPRYKEVSANDSEGHWDINILAIDPDAGISDQGSMAVLSITVTRGNYLWTHLLKVCGRDRVDTCASDIISSMDKNIEETQKSFSRLLSPTP